MITFRRERERERTMKVHVWRKEFKNIIPTFSFRVEICLNNTNVCPLILTVYVSRQGRASAFLTERLGS